MSTSDGTVSQSPTHAGTFLTMALAGWLVMTLSNVQAVESSSKPGLKEDFHVINEFVQSNCLDCHVGEDAERGFDLESFELESTDLANWSDERLVAMETMLLRISSGQMPPPDAARPTSAEYQAAIDAFSRTLAQHALKVPFAGDSEPLRRLTRTEYRNSIRDLLQIDVDVEAILPADSSSDGFDNITVGELSPMLVDRYLTAATRIARASVGSSVDAPDGVTLRLPPDQSQESHVAGLPLGTRGGTLIEHHFPKAGTYEIQARLTRDRDERVEGMKEPHSIEFLVDGKPLQRFELKPVRGGNDYARFDSHLNVRFSATPGKHRVGVTFVEKATDVLEIKRQPFDASFNRYRHPRQSPAVHEVSIVGPLNESETDQPSRDETQLVATDLDSPSRQAIFVTRPGGGTTPEQAARDIFKNLMRRAYRRDIDSLDLQTPMKFFHAEYLPAVGKDGGAAANAFEAGIEAGLTSILINPNFLFRTASQPKSIEPGELYPLPPFELATRLSYFLWSSLPDATLLNAAEQGELNSDAAVGSQALRMLKDPRSEALVTSFADQWLYLRNLPSITPDLRRFPGFDNNLREAFAEESRRLFADVIARDTSVLELIACDHTFLNDRLATHYGIPGIVGSHFRRVDLPPNSHRGGLLRHGSVLMATSYATRTSPTIRGAWVLENILGTPPPPPPPNVPTLKEKTAGQPLSFREMLAQHRADSACASCHDLIDPVGFALDRYDAVGRWQSVTRSNGSDGGFPIDVRGRLPDGQEVVGVEELERGILERPEMFVTALTKKLMTYALGRPIEYRDGPAIRQIVHDAAANGYRFSDLITGITTSTPFRMRTSR